MAVIGANADHVNQSIPELALGIHCVLGSDFINNDYHEMENLIASMDFQPGVPSRGKPKKKRKGAPTFNNRTASLAMDRPSPLIGISTSRKRPSDQVLTEEPQTKSRGRKIRIQKILRFVLIHPVCKMMKSAALVI